MSEGVCLRGSKHRYVVKTVDVFAEQTTAAAAKLTHICHLHAIYIHECNKSLQVKHMLSSCIAVTWAKPMVICLVVLGMKVFIILVLP